MQSHCGECLVKAAAGEPWSPLSESVLAAAILRLLLSEMAERVSFRVLRAQQLRPGGTPRPLWLRNASLDRRNDGGMIVYARDDRCNQGQQVATHSYVVHDELCSIAADAMLPQRAELHDHICVYLTA